MDNMDNKDNMDTIFKGEKHVKTRNGADFHALRQTCSERKAKKSHAAMAFFFSLIYFSNDTE